MRQCNTKTSHHAKLGYIAITIIACFMSLISLIWGSWLFEKLNLIGAVDCFDNDPKCIGISVVYRISFSLGMLFITATILSLIGGEIFEIFEKSCWLLKISIFLIVLFLTFMIPNYIFDWYIIFSVIVGIIFLVSQIIILIDFAYHWNEAWVENYENSNESRFWMFWLFFFPILCWILIFTMSISSYIYFQCPISIALTSLSLVFGIGLTAISSSKLIEHGCNFYLALLTSSFVSLIFNYWTFSSLASNPNEACNLWESKEHNFLLVGADLFVCILTLTYFAMKIEGKPHYEEVKTSDVSSLEMKSMKEITTTDEEYIHHENPTEKINLQQNSTYFHLLMTVYSLTLAMILTNWGLVTGWMTSMSFWIRICQASLCMVLFFWSVLAPSCCPDRDFSL